MSKKIEKMFIVGDISYGNDMQVYKSVAELEGAFDDGSFDEDEEILEVQVIKRYLVAKKLDLVEN